jgi:hypothetical protein
MSPASTDTGPAVYDPRGAVEAEPRPLAPRVKSLAGLRLGVLDNTKWNGRKLLERTVALLQEEGAFAEVRRYQKESFSRNADPALIGRIARECEAVVTAIGD